MKTLKYIFFLVIFIAAFSMGIIWEKHRILETGPVQLTGPLNLTGEKGNIGQLPEGTVLYPYSNGPSINT